MKNYNGGQSVKAGFYFNRDSWTISTISGKQGGVLAGDQFDKYLRLPALLMMVVGPMLGALLVVFIPVIGVVLLTKALYEKVSVSKHFTFFAKNRA